MEPKVKTIDKAGRANMVRAMEYIARAVNDESIFNLWLSLGVADGDIDGDETDEELYIYYEEDDDFAELMHTFLHLMSSAHRDGGLYFDNVVSAESNY